VVTGGNDRNKPDLYCIFIRGDPCPAEFTTPVSTVRALANVSNAAAGRVAPRSTGNTSPTCPVVCILATSAGRVSGQGAGSCVGTLQGPRVRIDTTRSLDEAKRLLNACDADFRPLVRAGLETGARYSELARLRVEDFNPDAGTLAIHKSKSLKPRHILLTPEAVKFFGSHRAGRSGLMFKREDGTPWQKNDQTRPMTRRW